ncbi:hypothetical protein MIND_00419000 [Mycena indigotica]|uniref:RNA polymerase II-associated protein 1 C-terminal domain-containing protein n=1 Tax=Mycena indigotica TaxID=2126181 RepID=A0A8H6SX39_9AGAR|nr:uncharacterized protein MIND_00419000 [Mycena indigotica]KAF7306281.1 hypothetical protein MIND_00419000 [Mycena indigotica]
MSSLVGAVFERSATSKPSSPFAPGPSSAGFPQATHRSKKSAFSKAREQNVQRRDHLPTVVPSQPMQQHAEAGRSLDWREQMSRENEYRVSAMTEDEREQEKKEILQRFGPGIGDILKKAREARERNVAGPSSPRIEPLPSALASPSRPASSASKKIRFAEVTESDVHVYESAPPSPRKKALALPPPSIDDNDAVSIGTWKGKSPASTLANEEPEEGTPEYIRRRFFPSAPSNNPNLAWMEESARPGSSGPASTSLRFDLSGNVLPPSLHDSLPTHLGLHHHAPDETGVQLAGYTLDDIFLMSRSEVKAQRAAAMRMLGGIADWANLNEDQAELRPRVLAAGIEAMAERGSLGLHAVEVVWKCLSAYAVPIIAGVELGITIPSLPLSHLLQQTATALETSEDPTSLGHLLAILRQLANTNNDTATEIVSTPSLISNLFRAFLLSSSHTSTEHANEALQLLTTLASSSRANARTLCEPADALLRFIAILPPPNPHLVTSTLAFYKTLASYGLYSNIASTAHLPLTDLARYIHDNHSLAAPWAELLEAWIVCATDPHHTTPEHDILWSQVVACGWGQDLLAIMPKLDDSDDMAAVWRATATWLEGARINGVRAGEEERAECLASVKAGFETEGGLEHKTVQAALSNLTSELSLIEGSDPEKMARMGRVAETLAAAIRLWLACLPTSSTNPISSPPFRLPFEQLSEICRKLVAHPVWSALPGSGAGYAVYRPLSSLLARYLRLSRHLPNISQDVWMAQALAVIARLLPGDEDFAVEVTNELIDLFTVEWTNARGFDMTLEFWNKRGLKILKPFLPHVIRPTLDVFVGPSTTSPNSIKYSTTQRLPTHSSAFSREYGVPLRRDWSLAPLDHLLRSGVSPAFQNLPPSWDGSEVDVTRAALLLTNICREISSRYSLSSFVLTREEAVFGCMKVFMLEHGQPHNDSAEEVFRDPLVNKLMDNLLSRYTAVAGLPTSPDDLEQAAIPFLGSSTPFYQYYTDFIALYDAISFSHPTFARLLLPPTTMKYAPDYRRHLWNDFAHVIRTIRVTPETLIAGDLGEYLWPVDSDPQMLGGYLRALLKDGGVQDFLRLVALHHVACNIWPDLRENGEDERAEKLLKAVIEQGSHDTVAEVMRYRQASKQHVSLPPDCFNIHENLRISRLDFVRRVGGDVLVERVHGLFSQG